MTNQNSFSDSPSDGLPLASDATLAGLPVTQIDTAFSYLVADLRTAVDGMNLAIEHAKRDQTETPDHKLRRTWGAHNALIFQLGREAELMAEMVEDHIRKLRWVEIVEGKSDR